MTKRDRKMKFGGKSAGQRVRAADRVMAKNGFRLGGGG
jgi:hypothetical protein